MTNEEIKKILDEAPDGATHVAWNGDYWYLNEGYNPKVYLPNRDEWFLVVLTHPVQELTDLKEILELRQEVERLQQRNAELEAHVERLKSFTDEAMDELDAWQQTGEQCEHWSNRWEEVKSLSPKQSLNALKREVAREAINNFAHRLVTRHIDMTDIYTWADRFLDEALDKYPTEVE